MAARLVGGARPEGPGGEGDEGARGADEPYLPLCQAQPAEEEVEVGEEAAE